MWKSAILTGLRLAGCAGEQVAVWYTGWAPALGQAPERRPGGCPVSPALARTMAAAAADGSARGRQLPDRWAGLGAAGLGFRQGEPWRAGAGLVFGWGWISYTSLVTREGKWFREGARLTQGHARSSVLEQGLGFGLAAFQPLPGLYRALCGAPLPYPPPSASDYLGWPNPAGPGLTHGAPGEEWQPGQCPRGTAHSGGWRGPQ